MIKASILFLATLVGCQGGVDHKDVILFTGTEMSPVVKFVVEEPREMGITISATDKVLNDVNVTVQVDKEKLAQYNEEMGRNYFLPPVGTYELEANNVMIKAGNTISEPLKFRLKSFDGFEEGKQYCVPITITNTNGNMPILGPSSTLYVLINRTLITKAVDFRGQNAFNVPLFKTDPRVSNLDALTMEARVLIHSFPGANDNPGISSVMGIEENFLLRFCAEGQGQEKNKFQGGPCRIAGHKYFPFCPTNFGTEQWYQLVCVYDGSNISIYVNGILDVKMPAGPGSVNLNDNYFDGFWFGQSCGGRRLNGAISEARFWTKALTLQEIQDNACYVDPKTPGLLAYWRFNTVQEDGKTVRDETGNGFDAVSLNSNIQWINNVKCPF